MGFESHVDGVGPGVFEGVGHCLTGEEVGGGFNLGGEATTHQLLVDSKVNVDREPGASVFKGSDKPSIAQYRRVDALSQFTDLDQDSLGVPLNPIQRLDHQGITIGAGAGDSQLCHECGQVLLGSVVDVAFDPPPLFLLSMDDSGCKPDVGDRQGRLTDQRLQQGDVLWTDGPAPMGLTPQRPEVFLAPGNRNDCLRLTVRGPRFCLQWGSRRF